MFRLVSFVLAVTNLIQSQKIMCPYVTQQEDDIGCSELLTEYKQKCEERIEKDTELFKVKEFRAQVVCDYVDSDEFTEIIANLDTEFDEEAFKTSKEVEDSLKSDLMIRISRHVEEEVKTEVNVMVENSRVKIENFKQWLTDVEQGYLRSLSHVLQRHLGRTVATSPATGTPSDEPTTFQQFPSTEYVPSDKMMELKSIYWTSSSPLLVNNFDLMKGEWIFNGDEEKFTEPAKKFNSNSRFNLVYRVPYVFYVFHANLDKVPSVDCSDNGDCVMTMFITFKNCWDVSDQRSLKWHSLAYFNVQFDVNAQGWVTLTYDNGHHKDGVTQDPLQNDGTEGSMVVVIGPLFGSTARWSDCTNEIPGPGVYRMFNNGTCTGMPLFSKKAAQVEERCSDSLIPGSQISHLSVKLFRSESPRSTPLPMKPFLYTGEPQDLSYMDGFAKFDPAENPGAGDVTPPEPEMVIWSTGGRRAIPYNSGMGQERMRFG